MGKSQSTQREPTHTQTEHANSTQKSPSQDLNQEPPYCEGMVLTITPSCRPWEILPSKQLTSPKMVCGFLHRVTLASDGYLL